jgi:hypothetical protein
MTTPVEIYRGIEIHYSKLVVCDSGSGTERKDSFAARLDDWLIIGPLQSVRDQIDQRLDKPGRSN